jgi:N-acylneuraminate cytidylyltransferase
MHNLLIIPARGGSKRIPKKNIKIFNGKPIISWVIEEAKESGFFNEIMVSTDDTSIAEIAKQYGAKVPFYRSEKNANDFATLADVILEVITQYKNIGKYFENICCILPTAALIKTKRILEGFNKLNDYNYKTVVPVIKYSYPIQRSLKENNGILSLKEEKYINTRSQDLEDFYHDSGQFYWLNTKNFLAERKIFTDNTGFIEIKEYEAQDVDTLDDWEMLKLKYNFKK